MPPWGEVQRCRAYHAALIAVSSVAQPISAALMPWQRCLACQHRQNDLGLEATHGAFDEQFDRTPGNEPAPAEPETWELLPLDELVDEVIGNPEHLGSHRHRHNQAAVGLRGFPANVRRLRLPSAIVPSFISLLGLAHPMSLRRLDEGPLGGRGMPVVLNREANAITTELRGRSGRRAAFDPTVERRPV